VSGDDVVAITIDFISEFECRFAEELRCADYHSNEAVRLLKALCDEVVRHRKACMVGEPCQRHHDQVHGREANELRDGITKLIESDLDDYPYALRELLDEVDARDSLAFLENTVTR
jgi:hypothetical protein